MKKYWTTKEGEEIEYSKLEDSHLLNILAYIEKVSKKGLLVTNGGGVDSDDIWFDETEVKGTEVKHLLDYYSLRALAKKRGLLKELIK